MSIPARTVGYWAGTRGITLRAVANDRRFKGYVRDSEDEREFRQGWREGFQDYKAMLLDELESILMDVSVES